VASAIKPATIKPAVTTVEAGVTAIEAAVATGVMTDMQRVLDECPRMSIVAIPKTITRPTIAIAPSTRGNMLRLLSDRFGSENDALLVADEGKAARISPERREMLRHDTVLESRPFQMD
jgi:hypothetical protein